MSSRRKKVRNKMARQVLSGKVTVTEARARLGREIARKQARKQRALLGPGQATAAVKSAGGTPAAQWEDPARQWQQFGDPGLRRIADQFLEDRRKGA
jgi:hypothetical protein